MNILTKRIKFFLLGLLLPLASLSHADDTEIFYLGETVTPKVMMVLDTSGSMGYHVSNNQNRITVMKDAMTQFITQASGTNIGIMRTNQRTGAVIYPVSNLEASITNDTVHRFDRPMTDDRDNASETSNGSTFIYVNTNGSTPSTDLEFDFSDTIGLRFQNIVIPQGHTVTNAYLQVFPLHTCASSTCSSQNIKIRGEKSANSAQFAETTNNISSRPLTSAVVTHNLTDWKDTVSQTGPYKIDDDGLTNIVQEIVDQSDWESGNALSFIIDTSHISSNALGGIRNTASLYFSSTLFIEVEAYNRVITVKDKMLEALNNHRLTNYTPSVPSLFEAVKYMKGANLASTHNSDFNTTRSGSNGTGLDYNDLFERLPHSDSYENGNINYPSGCVVGWLNDQSCRDISISANGGTLKYDSPLTDTCDDGSIILLTDGDATHYSGNSWWQNMQSDITTTINTTTSTTTACEANQGSQSLGYPENCGKELAKNIHSDGITVDGLTEGGESVPQHLKLYTIDFNNDNDWLQTMATEGGGEYKQATSTSDLYSAFEDFQGSIISDAISFSNTSVSLNTSNQLNHNNNLYYSLFTPSESASWRGNLKRYKLSSNGSILDQDGDVATNPDTGLFLETSKSYWNDDVDGSLVANGGAAQRLNSITRKIYVNDSAATTGLTLLNDSNNPSISHDDFNLEDDTAKEEYIDWMLLQKTIADPLHSTPVEVSYTTGGSVIFFGDNQGYIHAIDADTGNELWAFMPKEMLKKQPDIRTNATTNNHIYGMDGNIVPWQEDNKQYITVGMRRGGSSYYTLDVTSRTVPKFEWKITSTDTDFTNLGQTWSTPIKTKVKQGSDSKSVLIFAGGYDTNQDDVTTRTEDNVGDSLYIVEATTGAKVFKKDDLGYSIPSDIKAIDIDGDGNADQIYVGDMGGRVLRFTLDGSTLEHRVIANIAGDSAVNNRRFYHAPDISVLAGTSGETLAVAIGSGFHAHPNNATIADNFYMFKQDIILPTLPVTITQSDLLLSTVIVDGDALKAKSGWYLPLNTTGEKSLSSSLTFDDAVWFTTYEPVPGTTQCIAAGGISRFYRVGIADGAPKFQDALPDVVDGEVDESKSCDSEDGCSADDRFTELELSSIPTSPVLLYINDEDPDDDENDGSGAVVCVNTFCQELEGRKSSMNYWKQQ